MDSFYFSGVHKVEKPNNLWNLFRVIGLLILIFSFAASHLHISIKFMTEFFHSLKIVLLSPSSMFILGITIIFTLFSISGYFSSNKTDFYAEFIQKREEGFVQRKEEEEETKYHPTTQSQSDQRPPDAKVVVLQRSTTTMDMEKLRSPRCRQEKVMTGRRSMFPDEDFMSKDEFRRKIDGFIARQQRILREDEDVTNYM